MFVCKYFHNLSIVVQNKSTESGCISWKEATYRQNFQTVLEFRRLAGILTCVMLRFRNNFKEFGQQRRYVGSA